MTTLTSATQLYGSVPPSVRVLERKISYKEYPVNTLADLATLKKVMVAPSSTTPYRILVCLARSSAESMGDSILSTVRKAAKLAV
ncbi:hypothetical protein EYF80_027376 [Liparis tanakae]|uniref:Uncharacterized protein n=1 Tax=Liparis tanakae TaxID=230148 RepID=A0A4Z2HAT4_9TELE|nr:hypothetical protein EYF80_027376 [Liparis tanakae]